MDRSNKPGALSVSHDHPSATIAVTIESDRAKIALPSGESAEILFYGATVVSWKAGGVERLFLSEKAKLDGSKAVRGGIPLVFPVFGKSTQGPTAALPQHGFARICKWEVLGRTDESDTSIQLDFGLGPDNLPSEIREQWPYNFGLIYSVCLGKDFLQTKMLVRNGGDKPFDFNVLFHTYLRVPEVTAVKVSGLKGVTYRDKVLKGKESIEEQDELTINSEVDCLYAKVPGSVTVSGNGNQTLCTIQRTNLDDIVVWNPWEGSSEMADFGPTDGYKKMLCVEAGAVSEWQTLEPQNIWEGSVVHSLS